MVSAIESEVAELHSSTATLASQMVNGWIAVIVFPIILLLCLCWMCKILKVGRNYKNKLMVAP